MADPCAEVLWLKEDVGERAAGLSHLSQRVSVCPFVCLPACLPACLSGKLSASLSVCLREYGVGSRA
eukprot:10151333-Alexandrium_andersonii.AAC.1